MNEFLLRNFTGVYVLDCGCWQCGSGFGLRGREHLFICIFIICSPRWICDHFPSRSSSSVRDTISETVRDEKRYVCGTYDQGFTYCDIGATVHDEKCDSAVLFLV